MIKTIQQNKQFLSEIDGAIGDGDHGINMNKGFTLAEKEIEKKPVNLSQSLQTLSNVLMSRIGGAMGPLYGMFFRSMAKTIGEDETIDASTFGRMLEEGEKGIIKIGKARVGDKTMLDSLNPAIKEFNKQIRNGKSFRQALEGMKKKALEGRNSTKDMIARIGRASQMGERSIGLLDPGAVSMSLILISMADSVKNILS